MKKMRLLLIIGILLCVSTVSVAEESNLGVDFDTTYVSKYMWRGFDILDDVSAFQPSINIDLGSGFSANIWASYAGSGGSTSAGSSRVNLTEYDYTIAYACTLFESESYATDVAANYIYYDFTDEPTRAADAMELGVAFAWPDICPFGIVPSYYVGKIWEARSNSALGKNYEGWVHVLGLGYDLTVEGLLPNVPEQVISLIAAATYNDGYGGTAEHDWSHVVLGASTSLDCGPGTFTPALYFQKSMDDAVNTEDEFWTSLSYTISF